MFTILASSGTKELPLKRTGEPCPAQIIVFASSVRRGPCTISEFNNRVPVRSYSIKKSMKNNYLSVNIPQPINSYSENNIGTVMPTNRAMKLTVCPYTVLKKYSDSHRDGGEMK